MTVGNGISSFKVPVMKLHSSSPWQFECRFALYSIHALQREYKKEKKKIEVPEISYIPFQGILPPFIERIVLNR